MKELKNQNAQNEYYLTDMIKIFHDYGYKVEGMIVEDANEVMGVNDRVQLAQATKVIQRRINTHWMNEGVTLVDPESTWIDASTTIGSDSIIEPNSSLIHATIGEHVHLKGACVIEHSSIGDHSAIDQSKVIDSTVGKHTTVGPSAHLRNHCVIGNHCRIGNFVEMKKTIFDDHSKSAHLTYLGDAIVGKHVNIGCGVVTVNYDGKHKFNTIIKDGAFVGSNSNLIAPITIGENALVAAGSTLTCDVEDQAMGIARAYQVNKPSKGLAHKQK